MEKRVEKRRQRRKAGFYLFGDGHDAALQQLMPAAALPGSRNALAPAQKWPAMTMSPGAGRDAGAWPGQGSGGAVCQPCPTGEQGGPAGQKGTLFSAAGGMNGVLKNTTLESRLVSIPHRCAVCLLAGLLPRLGQREPSGESREVLRGSILHLQHCATISPYWCTQKALVCHHLSLVQAAKSKVWSGDVRAHPSRGLEGPYVGGHGTRMWSHLAALPTPCLHVGKPGAGKGWVRGFHGEGIWSLIQQISMSFPMFLTISSCLWQQQLGPILSGDAAARVGWTV